MGLLSFMKRKQSDLPMPNQPKGQDISKISDLPPIDPNSIGGSSMERLPTPYDSSDNNGGPKSMSVNIPTLDFSMPPPDDLPEGVELANIQNQIQSTQPNMPELPKLEPFDSNMSRGWNNALSPDELNTLFLSDTDWKEPDWKQYDPYNAEKIEEPSPEDFTSKDLPQFDDTAGGMISQDVSDEPVEDEESQEPNPLTAEAMSEPGEPFMTRSDTGMKPIELYIRGKAYSKVFMELEQMGKSLSRLDALTGKYEDMVKQEEPLLTAAKEQMEYAYKKLSQIDKKIFVQ